MSHPLLTATEAAERLGISRETFYRWDKLGKFDRVKANAPMGRRRFVADAIDRINDGESPRAFNGRTR